MSSCFGFRKPRSEDHEPLLPRYHDDTQLQTRLHEKLHSYQMFRAMSKGFMPSNEQLVINIRTLLSADILNPDTAGLSDSSRLLVKYSRQWLHQFIDLLLHKNGEDQIQDFIWFLSKSRISIDTANIAQKASRVKARADTAAAYQSLQTVGSLLLTNSDFRVFLSDLQTVGRDIFKDSAFAVSRAAEDVGNKIDPSDASNGKSALIEADASNEHQPSNQDLAADAQDVAKVLVVEAGKVGKETKQSVIDHFSGDERQTLIDRLKKAVVKLRQRNDYSDSVSTLSHLIKRYAVLYSRAAQDVVSTTEEDVNTNEELNRALKNLWSLVTSFGSRDEWDELEARLKKVAEHKQNDPEFEKLMNDVGNALQQLFTDPDFLQNADQKFSELRRKFNETESTSSLRDDVNELLEQVPQTLYSILRDDDISKLINTAMRIIGVLSPAHAIANKDLFQDSINVFLPMVIQAIQYVPIPRLEVSTPELDLLLENLVIEPGTTINGTSFLPFRLRVETYNDLEIRKARMRTVSKVTSLVTVKLDGISLRADEIGFWMRAHSGILRLADEGIASIQLDERGVDIHIDVEIGQEKLEKILTLKAVRVHIHKLRYQLRKSRFSWLAWLCKPLLQPIVRKVVEKQVSTAIADMFHSANRELLFARERLRATRISDPKDLQTFFKAIVTRLTPDEDPDTYTRVGVAEPGKGVFKGVYAPGSVVKLWNEEASRAGEVVDDYDRGGWRNDVFDVGTY